MSLEDQINDLIEYKRLVNKLEDELNKKSSEISLLSKNNIDLKSLCQELQNECDEINKKLKLKNTEMKKLEKKYKEEKEILNQNFEKQKEIYEEKILKLSFINPINKEISLEREIQIRYEEKYNEKNREIEILKNKIRNLEYDNNELRLEIVELKKMKNQLNVINEEKNFFDDMLKQNDDENKKKENEYENKIKNLNLIIIEKEQKIGKLYEQLNELKIERDNYELNISKKYIFDLNKLKEEENKNNHLKQELSKKDEELEQIKNKLKNLQEIAEKSKEENELIAKEKNDLELKIVELEEINDYNNKEISND